MRISFCCGVTHPNRSGRFDSDRISSSRRFGIASSKSSELYVHEHLYRICVPTKLRGPGADPKRFQRCTPPVHTACRHATRQAAQEWHRARRCRGPPAGHVDRAVRAARAFFLACPASRRALGDPCLRFCHARQHPQDSHLVSVSVAASMLRRLRFRTVTLITPAFHFAG